MKRPFLSSSYCELESKDDGDPQRFFCIENYESVLFQEK